MDTTEETSEIKKDDAAEAAQEASSVVAENEDDQFLPEPNFTTFIYSLSTAALMQLGEIENPETGKKDANLQLAKHTIDLLEMLQKKTENNLTEEEAKLMEGVLGDLRMCYCKAKD
jgi:hypothetical protein